MVGDESFFNTHHHEESALAGKDGYGNDLTDGMDGELITQIRDLSKEYRRQSRE